VDNDDKREFNTTLHFEKTWQEVLSKQASHTVALDGPL
jgi:hypothetical protein